MLDHLITTSDAASMLQLHPETIKRFCRLGKLKADKLNNGWLIPKEEIDAFASTYKETRGRPTGRHLGRNGGMGWQNSKT